MSQNWCKFNRFLFTFMRTDWISTSLTKPYLAIWLSYPRIDYPLTHFPHITIYKWGTWELPINSKTAIQICFMKTEQLYWNSTPSQMLSREFSEMLRRTISVEYLKQLFKYLFFYFRYLNIPLSHFHLSQKSHNCSQVYTVSLATSVTIQHIPKIHRSALCKITIDLLYFWDVSDVNLWKKISAEVRFIHAEQMSSDNFIVLRKKNRHSWRPNLWVFWNYYIPLLLLLCLVFGLEWCAD